MWKVSKAYLIAIVVAIIFCTQLRGIFTLMMPLALIFANLFFSYKVSPKTIFLIILIVFSAFWGLIFNRVDLANTFLFCWLVIPIIILLFCNIIPNKKIFIPWEYFFKALRNILIVINIIGFISLFIIYKTVDDFGRGYGPHFNGVSGLAVVNAYVVFYYISLIYNKKYHRKDIFYCLFFTFSFIFCFSGLTLLTFFATLGIFLLTKINIKRLIAFCIIIITSYYILKKVSPDILTYNMRNIEIFMSSEQAKNNARKRVMFENYIRLVAENKIISIFTGVGPGGYNSRSCFLINNDSDNFFTKIMGHHMPYFHEKDIYPLWNSSIVSYERFTDGARNKPFSSIISLSAELGIIFFTFFLAFWIKQIIQYSHKTKFDKDYFFLFLLNIFMILLLLSNYWLESSEFLLFIFIQNSILQNKKISQ